MCLYRYLLLLIYEIIFFLVKTLDIEAFIVKNSKDCYEYILNTLNIKDTFLIEIENKTISDKEYKKRVQIAKIEFHYGLTDK